MVARPPVAVVIDRMTVEDLTAVHEIERESFTAPWPPHAYRQEIEKNKLAHYLVARYGDRIVGFAGIWLLVDEAHVTTFATRTTWRRQGIGERMILALLDLAAARGAVEATLEVRPTNLAARRLYEKFGFRVVGVRPRYYSDNNEDALIMTTELLDSPGMVGRLARLRAELAVRPDIVLGEDGLPIGGDEEGSGEGATEGAAREVVAEAGELGPAEESGSAEGPREPRIIRPSSITRRSR
jgi:ribosomal-protein-alanine N-acetyltransferase